MTMEQIADWLEKRGMSEYTQRFIENHIDLSVLPDLTEEDLEKLGVLLGDRRKMLRWIADLKAGENVPLASGIAAAAPEVRGLAESAERRQVTVMFSDLVGSTALSARMDPEDLREVVLAYQNVVAETVGRFDGFVAEYHGDGVLVYFGFPRAHEDDPERAVRAGLELIAAVPAIESRASLQTRIGIATGLVVVGDLIGSGDTKERSIIGETPNLAARLQAIAEPNTVVIADSTRGLLGDLFELRDLGSRDFKGISRPMRPWAVLRPSRVESRFDALHTTGLSALVGREEEFELLLRRWSRAKAGEGQVVLVAGEPGIGKSRLTAALLEHLAAESHTRLRYFCSPQHTDSAFYPLIAQLERTAGLAHDDKPQAKLDKLQAILSETSTSIQDAALFSELLSLPNDGRFPALDLAPLERRQRTLQALTARFSRLAGQQPLLMIFEDVHWIDPTSLEVLGLTVDLVKTLPALLIVTFRPEFNAPWVGQAHVTSLALNRLGQRDVAAMIAHLVGRKGPAADVLEEIVERTDGVPLFVEEMTKAVLEAESEGAARRVVAAVTSPDLPVPASLHASLIARLDRLGPAKEVAQIGAAIGRTFSHALLASVVRETGTELETALDRLVQADLLLPQGIPPHASYLFKHSLVQDAAYGMLLREPRRALHARIAESIEKQFPEVAERQPELLARHYTEAGPIAKAAVLWGKAGERSLARSALVEAAVQLTRALEQMATLPGTAALRREQIKLQLALAHALMHTKGYAAPETKAAIEQARSYLEAASAAGEPPDDPLLLFSVLFGFWVANYVAFDGDVVRDLAGKFMQLAEQQGATAPLMIAHGITGISLLYTGSIAQGRDHLDRAMALYNPTEHRPLAMRFGQSTVVSRLCHRSWALWILGYPEAARLDVEHALREAREVGQAGTLMFALRYVILVHIWRGDYVAANALMDELGGLAHTTNANLWKAAGMAERVFLSALTGKTSNIVNMTTSALEAVEATGTTLTMPRSKTFLAYAHARVGEFEDAWRCIAEAMKTVETTKERWFEAEIYRTAGEITLLSPEHDAAKAEDQFERALCIAREQKAKSWELRAAMSMARLWRDQGKRRHAHDLLAGVYGWFSEGFDTLDLKQAKILLKDLA
jgi:class 3 adenylate cyclase/predicted ATPase